MPRSQTLAILPDNISVHHSGLPEQFENTLAIEVRLELLSKRKRLVPLPIRDGQDVFALPADTAEEIDVTVHRLLGISLNWPSAP